MKERRFIKLRTDMYEDTKMKIIDRNPRRDLIHYIWNRLVVLAGKVNKEGELFMSRTIPYTIESLAVEFNREPEEIKLAMDLLIQLEMMEYKKEGVYIVKNFAKHQNIKIKEKDKEVVVKVQDKLEENKEEYIQKESKDEEQVTEIKEQEKEQHNINNENYTNAKIWDNLSNKQDTNVTEAQESKSLQKVSAESLSIQKHIGKKVGRKKMKNLAIICEEDDDNDEQICSFTEGEYVLGENETLIRSLTFCGDEIIENIN
ncbi:phage replisome organizer N-terminal domain-containing protein [Clostridium sp. C2-6-12]|uniref:phage replisome organizer N-terminal domain-containing protein n=1 Tax=Clostridium sp. C2-6-12 TaxID=2698832 RepID=UPI0013720249|nr:phage replisome organizer N-terminal domain-containing protein [Clostridium sp. C2-6-12]